MKKLATLGLALVAVLALTAVAVAQVAPLAVSVDGKVLPNKGGTKKKPKNAKVRLSFTVNPESRKTVATLILHIPQAIKLSGKGFKTCNADRINQLLASGGNVSQCPKGSKLGTGTATAVLGPQQSQLNFNTTVFVGASNAIALYLEGVGNDVSVAFPGPISKDRAPFGQQIRVAIPTSVQQPIPGLFSYITSVNATLAGKATKGKGKKKKTYYFASLTGCPKSGENTTGVQFETATNDAGPGETTTTFRDTQACR